MQLGRVKHHSSVIYFPLFKFPHFDSIKSLSALLVASHMIWKHREISYLFFGIQNTLMDKKTSQRAKYLGKDIWVYKFSPNLNDHNCCIFVYNLIICLASKTLHHAQTNKRTSMSEREYKVNVENVRLTWMQFGQPRSPAQWQDVRSSRAAVKSSIKIGWTCKTRKYVYFNEKSSEFFPETRPE